MGSTSEQNGPASHIHKDYIMSKTPFEIRLDLLNLANGILNDKIWVERHRLQDDWNTQREIILRNNLGKIPPAPVVPVVKEDDIITLARKLNEFVSNG